MEGDRKVLYLNQKLAVYQICFSEPKEYILVPILYCVTFYASKSENVVLTYSMLNFWVLLTKFDESIQIAN